MALIMLPCDMPWWDVLQDEIKNLAAAQNVDELIRGMQVIHTMCNVGLDPDEADGADPQVLIGLKRLMSEHFTDEERQHFFQHTLTSMLSSALRLRSLKPVDGLKFILQQEASVVEVKHDFASALIAHAFLSTFPKRTHKTHPTLQDFNFCSFFRHLNENFQKSKLKSIFHYFDLQNKQDINSIPSIKIIRQVMKSCEWLTIEDWLECSLPLCPLNIRHDNRMEKANAEFPNSTFVCFSSKKPGGRVLNDGTSMECIQFVTAPELLVMLLGVEALEDNEVLIVENLLTVARINNFKSKALFQPLDKFTTINVCCLDAENYSHLPFSQYEEDNLLRELNKALLGFRRRGSLQPQPHAPSLSSSSSFHQPLTRRLSPIGESFSTTPTDMCFSSSNMQQQISTRSNKREDKNINRRNRRFIVLGSSGECLPITRFQTSHGYLTYRSSQDYYPSSSFSSCASASSSSSSPAEFFSATGSVTDRGCEDISNEEENARRYSGQLDTPEHRNSFADQLRKALRQAQTSSTDSNSSYAVDISVTGSSIADPNIRMKRGGSRGFMLEDDDTFAFDKSGGGSGSGSGGGAAAASTLETTRTTRNNFKRNKGDSSRYSFSTDYNSDLEDVYEQLNRWLEETEIKTFSTGGDSTLDEQQQKIRDATVIQFAGSLLKRTLSESFVGIPLTEGGDCCGYDDEDSSSAAAFNEKGNANEDNMLKVKILARSLSLELAKHKHKVTNELVSVIRSCQNCVPSVSVVTGNWGCGSRHLGDPQLKLIIQWVAASVASVAQIVYYTYHHRKLLKLDTLCRVLVDRQWNVGELIKAVIRYIHMIQQQQTRNAITSNNESCENLFDLLINSADEKITCANIHRKTS